MTKRKKFQEILFYVFEELSYRFETLMDSNKLAKQTRKNIFVHFLNRKPPDRRLLIWQVDSGSDVTSYLMCRPCLPNICMVLALYQKTIPFRDSQVNGQYITWSAVWACFFKHEQDRDCSCKMIVSWTSLNSPKNDVDLSMYNPKRKRVSFSENVERIPESSLQLQEAVDTSLDDYFYEFKQV